MQSLRIWPVGSAVAVGAGVGAADVGTGDGNPDTNIVGIINTAAGMKGTLPESQGQLSKLIFFKITTSELGGNLPSSLYSLTLLTHLWITPGKGSSTPGMTGTISPDIAKLQDLLLIQLSHNQLRGTLPTTMQKLTNIVGL